MSIQKEKSGGYKIVDRFYNVVALAKTYTEAEVLCRKAAIEAQGA